MQTEEKKTLLLEKIDFGSGIVKDYKTYMIDGIPGRAYSDVNYLDHIPNGFHVEYPGDLAIDIYWREK